MALIGVSIAESTATLAAVVMAPDEASAQAARDALAATGIEVTATVRAADPPPAVDGDPDVVVVQYEGGATRRARFIRQLRRQTDAQVVVIGDAGRGHDVRSAMEAGASGYVFSTDLDASLAPTIRAACAGQVAVPRRERRQIERPTLSGREKQILGLVVMGYMNCEIAEKLFLAESTVKSHLCSAFAKLGVRSRNEAVDLILSGDDGLGRGILAITPDLGTRAS